MGTQFIGQININIIQKAVICPTCQTHLQCYGYLVDRRINCYGCNNSFILTRELWSESFVELNDFCQNCKQHVLLKVLIHNLDEKWLKLECETCFYDGLTVHYF